ncbi:S-layer homology domain-containing protein [Sedimentibacter sp. zth1]|uniref:S-layer homology domain-containing protein n=1 Tax=Sedimentibacter sp. zth1 TaxID=2816908 RepID=UPI001A92A812|nr:S-layer homology domain-containing protein [Sedimentibacter sp. zth1]QSX06072.1 S-layer homology domain-containing protein [Sedimentibacter sp. zth1]
MKKILVFIFAIALVLANMCIAYGDEEVNEEIKDLQFSDVKETDWFYSNVKEMVEKGIVNGYGDGTFQSRKAVKADEFIKMVLVAFNYDVPETDSTYWADGFIQKAEELKIADKTFINDYRYNLTREQAARIIVNTLYLKESHPSNSYNEYIKNAIYDYHLIADKYKQDMIDCYALGIMQGNDKGKMKPQDTITRAEATTVILRMMNKDRRLSVDFGETKSIVVRDGWGGNYTVVAPMYNGKPVNEIIEIAEVFKTNSSKGAEDIGAGDVSICVEGYETIERMDYVRESNDSGDPTWEDIIMGTNWLDWTFTTDLVQLSGKFYPYDFTTWNKTAFIEDETYLFNNDKWGEYFLTYYKEPFEKTFKILFEDDFDEAWKYFVTALNYTGKESKVVEKEINSRWFFIAYGNDGMQMRISLKDAWK